MKFNQNKRLLAVDPSLTASGWALFSLETSKLLAVGLLTPPGPVAQMPDRLRFLQNLVEMIFEDHKLGEQDFLICEGPAPLVKNPETSTKVEQVRGIFETLARVYGVEVPGRVNPRTVQTELLGFRGPQLARKEVKQIARETAIRLYGEELKHLQSDTKISQDIIDAVLIGAYAVSQANHGLKLGMNMTDIFSANKRSRSVKAGRGMGKGWTEQALKKMQS